MEVNPELVTLARVSRGWSAAQLAEALRMSSSAFNRYESGRVAFPADRVEDLVFHLDYPASFFTRRSAPVYGVGPDSVYHRKRSSAGKRVLARAYALAEVRRLEAQKLEAFAGLPAVPRYPSERYDDPAKVARTLRAKWSVPMGPVFNLTRLAEDNGLAVYVHNFGTRYIDGFMHISSDRLSVIHMNRDLPPDRWRWTLAHELGHLVMHRDFPSDAADVEGEANAFAAEFLAPAYEIGPSLFNLDESGLFRLKSEWRISMSALIRRAWDLGIIDSYRKRRLFIWLSKSGYRSREPDHLDPPVEYPALPARMVLRCVAELGFDRPGLLDYLAIGAQDFEAYYGTGLPGAGVAV